MTKVICIDAKAARIEFWDSAHYVLPKQSAAVMVNAQADALKRKWFTTIASDRLKKGNALNSHQVLIWRECVRQYRI